MTWRVYCIVQVTLLYKNARMKELEQGSIRHGMEGSLGSGRTCGSVSVSVEWFGPDGGGQIQIQIHIRLVSPCARMGSVPRLPYLSPRDVPPLHGRPEDSTCMSHSIENGKGVCLALACDLLCQSTE